VIEIISEAVWRRIFATHKGNALEKLWASLFLKKSFSGIDEAAIAEHPAAKETTALVRHPKGVCDARWKNQPSLATGEEAPDFPTFRGTKRSRGASDAHMPRLR
jgi:hypothetical protein